MDHRGNEAEAGFTDHFEISTPSGNPASGSLRIYAKSDDNLYKKNSAGTEVQVGSGTGNFILLYDNLLSGTAASFDITSISASYKHLKLVFYLRGTNAADGTEGTIRFNNDSGSNYDSQRNVSFGSSTAGGGTDAGTGFALFAVPQANSAASSFAGGELIIPNYAATTGHKSVSGFSFAYYSSARNTADFGGRWRSTAAINQITVLPPAGNWDIGSRVTLYGLS